MNGYINNSLLLLDSVIEQLKNGFVACNRCGDQEDTNNFDCMEDLKLAKSELLFFIKNNQE